jgi:CheY-like chemotaxis protein
MAPISILLVEDEALISMLVSDWLNELGFDVHEARTAGEALDYIDAGGPVDVLFTDINLPGGMTGAELAQRARALKPDLPVVYASGRYRGDDLGGLVPHSAFLSKPYDQRKLANVLEQIAVGTAH